MTKLRDLAPDLAAMVFISMTKSVSRGMTTAGAIISNHTAAAMAWRARVSDIASAMDTVAKPDQLVRLCENHVGVEKRCGDAYAVAAAIGRVLQDAVLEATSEHLRLAFVRPEHAEIGFTSSTFSFNLPKPAGCSDEVAAGLAQVFVDELTRDTQFKPCVSFGQDNGRVYCTVPATSTQGAIRAEDKAKQAVGGVQLVRLSFPPELDTDAASGVVAAAVATLYAR
jgi:hypothetical protein